MEKQTQFQSTGAQEHKPQENALEKQSQLEGYEDEYELSDFEKREHELLTSHVN